MKINIDISEEELEELSFFFAPSRDVWNKLCHFLDSSFSKQNFLVDMDLLNQCKGENK